ncbi:MAG: hypothetical protein Q7U54_17895 [Bacteroidales bacterium]|nr:hypothetical protein [Bacteroidales bacterium]
MGLTIHYSGRFNPNSSLSAMIEEVRDIAELYQWKFKIFETEFPAGETGKEEYNQKIYGICYTPPECETVWISFLSNGEMSSPMHLDFFGKKENQVEQPYLYMLSTKTQYAGIDIHKLIIHLFKYLEGKFLQQFTVMDEGHYWETGDEKLLSDTFKEYTELIEQFGTSLEIYPMNKDESFEAYFERLIKQMQSKRKEK